MLDAQAVIVNYATPDLTRKAAWSLLSLYGDLDIVVIDNASPDDSAGQLEDEIAANAWLTMPADRHILFHTPSEQRWAAAANHLGFDLNLISATAGHA